MKWYPTKEFREFIDGAIDQMENGLDEVIHLFAGKIAYQLIFMSPVDTGLFRGNWQVTMNQPTYGKLSITDQSGMPTFTREAAFIKEFKSPLSIWFTNNLPYAYALEMGHSKQAPHGMVGVTIPKLQRFIDESVQAVNMGFKF